MYLRPFIRAIYRGYVTSFVTGDGAHFVVIAFCICHLMFYFRVSKKMSHFHPSSKLLQGYVDGPLSASQEIEIIIWGICLYFLPPCELNFTNASWSEFCFHCSIVSLRLFEMMSKSLVNVFPIGWLLQTHLPACFLVRNGFTSKNTNVEFFDR